MTDFRALCAELIEAVLSDDSHIDCVQIARAARAALAEQPVEPRDGELNDTYWTAWHKHLDRTNSVLHSVGLRAVLVRWGRPAAAPVPVSERLPGPEDCDAEGRCWWGRFGPNDWCPDWTLTTHEVMLMFCDYSPREVWLPAHALPVPTLEEVM